MTVALTPAPRDTAPWVFDAASAYFKELVPDGGDLPGAEITECFDDPDTHVLLITHGQQRVGFALVDREDDNHDLCEFCILPAFRNQGLGTRAATLCFAGFPGAWFLGVANALPGTARFWDRILLDMPGITGLVRGPALTPYQSHSYTFEYKGTP